MTKKRTTEQRFWTRVDKFGPVPEYAPHLGPCWVWTGANWAGYGQIHVDGRTASVHRVAYELFVGPIPDGLYIDHLCRNRACARPDHLEAVTNAENIRRGMSPGMMAHRSGLCKRGHRLEGSNAQPRPDGCVACRECQNAARRARAAVVGWAAVNGRR